MQSRGDVPSNGNSSPKGNRTLNEWVRADKSAKSFMAAKKGGPNLEDVARGITMVEGEVVEGVGIDHSKPDTGYHIAFPRPATQATYYVMRSN